jgi:hypothetical protein
MIRHIRQGIRKIRCRSQGWVVLMLIMLLMAFSGPVQTLAATAGKENMPLGAGMAVNKAQSLMAEGKADQALAHVHLTDNRFEKALAAMLSYSYLAPLTREESRLVADLYLSCNIPFSAARQNEAWLAAHGDTLSEKQVLERIKTISRAWLSAGDPDQALAWAKKGLAIKDDSELVRIRDYVLAIRKVPD